MVCETLLPNPGLILGQRRCNGGLPVPPGLQEGEWVHLAAPGFPVIRSGWAGDAKVQVRLGAAASPLLPQAKQLPGFTCTPGVIPAAMADSASRSKRRPSVR